MRDRRLLQNIFGIPLLSVATSVKHSSQYGCNWASNGEHGDISDFLVRADADRDEGQSELPATRTQGERIAVDPNFVSKTPKEEMRV